jgi:hypothetical protein
MELHTNSNAVIYHQCCLALSLKYLSKKFVINICVRCILDVRRCFVIDFFILKCWNTIINGCSGI